MKSSVAIKNNYVLTSSHCRFINVCSLIFTILILVFSCFAAKAASNIQCKVTAPSSGTIGETVTISYKITGGSGKYTDTYISLFGRAGIYGGSNPIGNWDERQLTTASGTLTCIAPAGEELGIMISGNDEITGEPFWFSTSIPLSPNPNYQIALTADSYEHFKGDTINVNYNIKGLVNPKEVKAWWGIGKKSSSPELELNIIDISIPTGTVSYTPEYGDCVVCYISGKDKNGIPFFVKTDNIILKNKESYQPVSCTITTPASAEVGETIYVSYKITGGSGKYKNTYISVFGRAELYGFSSPIGTWDERELTNSSGKIQYVAPAGDKFGITISGYDAETNENFWFYKNFELTSNSSYPITLTVNRTEFYRGEKVTVNYRIRGLTDPMEAKIWWGIGKNGSSSSEFELNITNATIPSGKASFTPKYGDCVVCYCSGKDKNGIPFYAKTDCLILKDITEAEIQKLPSSLKRIESEAFAGTAFLAIEIPKSVTFIADDAFSGSNVLIIYGKTEYVKQYAHDHNIIYKAK